MTPKFNKLVKEAMPDPDWQDPFEGQHQWQKDMADTVGVQPEVIDANVIKNFWEKVIKRIAMQLPDGYEDLRYVGPMPPIKMPLKDVRDVYLQFGQKPLQPVLIADISRRVDKHGRSESFKLNNWRKP